LWDDDESYGDELVEGMTQRKRGHHRSYHYPEDCVADVKRVLKGE
jgi:hypothetical protein